MTVQQLLDCMLDEFDEPVPNTVDTQKSGDPAAEITGIATTFLASLDVLKEAVDLSVNVIITHEPTFYNHRDEVDWVEHDGVTKEKRSYIDEHGLSVLRFHDYWHRVRPDGILTGMVEALGWLEYQESKGSSRFVLPETSFENLVADVKAKLGIGTVRVSGEPLMPCRSVVLLVGATPGQAQIRALSEGADVVMVGETNEWETCEYVRDAISLGSPKGLIVLGHGNSEDAGMRYLVDWLKPRIDDGIPVHHIPYTDAFRFV